MSEHPEHKYTIIEDSDTHKKYFLPKNQASRFTSPDCYFNDMASNGKNVCVCVGNGIYVTNDGVNFQNVPLPINVNEFIRIIYFKHKFIAIAKEKHSYTNTVYFSNNGINWIKSNTNTTNQNYYNFFRVINNKLFRWQRQSSINSYPYISVSEDGITWTDYNTGVNTICDITYGDNTYVIVSTTPNTSPCYTLVYKSIDLSNWTDISNVLQILMYGGTSSSYSRYGITNCRFWNGYWVFTAKLKETSYNYINIFYTTRLDAKVAFTNVYTTYSSLSTNNKSYYNLYDNLIISKDGNKLFFLVGAGNNYNHDNVMFTGNINTYQKLFNYSDNNEVKNYYIYDIKDINGKFIYLYTAYSNFSNIYYKYDDPSRNNSRRSISGPNSSTFNTVENTFSTYTAAPYHMGNTMEYLSEFNTIITSGGYGYIYTYTLTDTDLANPSQKKKLPSITVTGTNQSVHPHYLYREGKFITSKGDSNNTLTLPSNFTTDVIKYLNNNYFMVYNSNDSYPYIRPTLDDTWTKITTPALITDITYNPKSKMYLCASGSNVLYSYDLTEWKTSPVSLNYTFNSINYMNGNVITIGNRNTVYSNSNVETDEWTLVHQLPSGSNYMAPIFAKNRMYLISQSLTTITEDGVNFITKPNVFKDIYGNKVSPSIYNIIYDKQFIACGTNCCMTSYDGINWRYIYMPFNTYMQVVSAADSNLENKIALLGINGNAYSVSL